MGGGAPLQRHNKLRRDALCFPTLVWCYSRAPDRNWLNKLANLNEWIEWSGFFTSRSRKTTADLLSLPSPFILYSTKLLNSNSAWVYIPRCVFPSKDSTSFFYSLSSSFFFFELARLLSGRNGTLCVKKRDSESIIKAHRLYAQRRMVSPFSVCAEDHS